jgi:hypothetical protein
MTNTRLCDPRRPCANPIGCYTCRWRFRRDAVSSGNFPAAIVAPYRSLVPITGPRPYGLDGLSTIAVSAGREIARSWIFDAHLGWTGFAPIRQPLDRVTSHGFMVRPGGFVARPILIIERALLNVRQPGTPSRDAIDTATRRDCGRSRRR